MHSPPAGVWLMDKNRWRVSPRTGAGWCAVTLFAAFIVAVAVGVAIDADVSIGELNVAGAINFLLGISAAAVAIYALLFRGERSFLVLLPCLLGLVIIGFELGHWLSTDS